jgi:pyruvate carboxylase
MHVLTTARMGFPTGTLSVYRHSAGFGMRMDGIGYSGMTITPYYDSLLVKYTAPSNRLSRSPLMTLD